jgi:beta-glucanase (GH16 family)
LEDKKKWEKTDEFKRQQEYLDLKKLPHLVKYFKYKGTTVFNFFNEWQVVFEDEFLKPQLDQEKWSTKSYIADKLLGDNYSLAGDNHVFNTGKNIKLNGKLSIEVKKEKASGKVWQMPAGFVPAELDYTTDLISSWKSFWVEDGIVEAKIKFSPVSQIVSSFYLAGEKEMPRLNLLEMGVKNRLGTLSLNSEGKANVNGMDISNLSKGKWYIFAIEKRGSSITWKINEAEILTIQSSGLNEKLHLNASSIVVNEVPSQHLPASFEIDWVRCYGKKTEDGSRKSEDGR